MPFTTFNPSYQGERTKSLERQIQGFQKLLKALSDKEIPDPVLSTINEEIEKLIMRKPNLY